LKQAKCNTDKDVNVQAFADLGIAVVGIIWGASTVVCKQLLTSLQPFAFQSIRFGLAFIVLGILFFPQLYRAGKKEWQVGIITGLAVISAYSLQIVGMLYTSATNTAFIISLGVIIIPLFNAFWGKKMPSAAVAASVCLCLTGLYLLTGWQGRFNLGDFLCLIGAVFCSIYYILNDHLTKAMDYRSVAAIQLLTGAVFSIIVALLTHTTVTMTQVRASWPALLFVGILATALVTPLQVASQRYTTTTRVGIILLLEPVMAAVLAFFFLHEILGPVGIIGCMSILSGLFLGEWKRV
jgi:Predicted permease, DMT superfamily